MPSDFDIKTGDIMIVKGKSGVSKLLAFGQKLFYFDNSSSHILISVADGFYIHATSEKGVHFISIKKLLPQIEPDYKIIRLNNINNEQYERLSRLITYYMGQAYSKRYFFEKTGASFCSELAAKIYMDAEITILDGKKSQHVIPAHFERLANEQNEEWENITSKTKECYKKLLADEHSYWVAEQTFLRIMALKAQRIQMQHGLYDIFMNSGLVSAKLSQTFDELQKAIAPKLQVPTWNDIHTTYYPNEIG